MRVISYASLALTCSCESPRPYGEGVVKTCCCAGSDRQTDRERETASQSARKRACVYVCVSERERERERERGIERKGSGAGGCYSTQDSKNGHACCVSARDTTSWRERHSSHYRSSGSSRVMYSHKQTHTYTHTTGHQVVERRPVDAPTEDPLCLKPAELEESVGIVNRPL